MNSYTVDVKSQCSEFPRHGKVIDVENSKVIIVDFNYPGHRAEVVSIDNCLSWEFDADHVGTYGGTNVQVLYRDSVDLPMCWIPGTFICGGAELGYALVEIVQNGQIAPGIFDILRVRNRYMYLSNKDIDMENDYHRMIFSHVRSFCKHRSTINVDLANLLTCSLTTFFELWSKWTNTKPMSFEEKTVTYISRSETAFTLAEVDKFCRYMNYELSNLQPTSLNCDVLDEDWIGRKWRNIVFATPHLLSCIIASMTSVEQHRCKTVSLLWNKIIQAQVFYIWIDLSEVRKKLNYQYLLAKIIFHLLNGNVKKLIIDGKTNLTRYTRIRLYGVIVTLLRALNIKVPFIILSNDNYESGKEFCLKFQGQDVWNRIAGSIMFYNIKFVPRNANPSFLVLSQLIYDPTSDKIISIFEKSCPSLTPEAFHFLHGTLARCQQDMQKRKLIWMNINKWNQRTKDSLDAEIPLLSTLNRFTLWNLLCLFRP